MRGKRVRGEIERERVRGGPSSGKKYDVRIGVRYEVRSDLIFKEE